MSFWLLLLANAKFENVLPCATKLLLGPGGSDSRDPHLLPLIQPCVCMCGVCVFFPSYSILPLSMQRSTFVQWMDGVSCSLVAVELVLPADGFSFLRCTRSPSLSLALESLRLLLLPASL